MTSRVSRRVYSCALAIMMIAGHAGLLHATSTPQVTGATGDVVLRAASAVASGTSVHAPVTRAADAARKTTSPVAPVT